MKIHRVLAPLLLVSALAGLAGCKQAQLPLLGHAPAWKLKDLDGKEVAFSQFQGKVVVVDFWATWCVPCIGEIPGYIRLQEKYGKDGLAIVGISLDEKPPAEVKQFVKDRKMNYQVVMGSEEVQQLFGGLDSIPTTFLIDRTGTIRDRKIGAEPAEEYERKIKAVLN